MGRLGSIKRAAYLCDSLLPFVTVVCGSMCVCVCGGGEAYYRLQLRSRDHGIGQLHLLGQHGHVLLLNQVVPPIDLQLGLQVRWGVQVFAILPGAAALRTTRCKGQESGRANTC